MTDLRAIALAVLTLFLSACGGGGGAGESLVRATDASDNSAPEVIATVPAANAVNISDSASVVLRFNEPLLGYTIRWKLIRLDNNQETAAFFKYHDALQAVVLTPHKPLSNNTQYQFQLLAATDLAGNAIEPTNLQFTTEEVSTGRPSIAIQPQAPEGDIFEGDSITLQVILSNINSPTRVTWLRDTARQAQETLRTTTLSNTTDSITLTLASSEQHSGYYYCRISNNNGATQTLPVYIAVQKPLELTQSPVSITRLRGSNISFSANFSGTEIRQLQWFKGDQALIESEKFVGVRQKILRINNISAEDAGQFYLRATTARTPAGIRSSPATLAVIAPVLITQPLQDQTVNEQSQLRLSVMASGSSPLSYQWFHNNVLMQGQTQSNLLINTVSGNEQGVYRVVVSNSHSSQESSARVSVIQGVNITRQPYDISVVEGVDASLSVIASGSAINYQWQKQTNQGWWLDISSAASATMPLKAISTADAGNYRVKVSNTINTIYSDTVNVYVGSSISITQQPQSRVVAAGTNAAFSVTATGSSLRYEWRKNGELIAGESSANLIINSASATDQATYQCRVISGNESVNCAQVSLTVAQPLSISGHPQSSTVSIGDWVNMRVTATGYNPRYRWYKNDSLIAGETGRDLSLGRVTAGSAGRYRVEVYNQFSRLRSNEAVVTVRQALRITSQPQNTTVNAGETIRLSVIAEGSGLSYEWFRDGIKLNGQSGTSLTITSANTGHSGSYSCRIWNSDSSVNCNAATVTVREAVSIYSHTQSFTIHEGNSTRLSVVARGYQPKYRWFKSGVLIPGEVGSQLSLSAVSRQDNATYRCEVYNDFSNVSCSNISLTVLLKPTIQAQPMSQQVKIGDNVTLAVSASGSGSLRYQWYRNSQALSGETSRELVLNNIQSANLGAYYCRVSNSVGSVNSNTATLSETPVYRVRVSWAKPTQREDGASLTDDEIASYRIYMQVSNNAFSLAATVHGANTTSAIVPDLSPGSYTFKVRTVDSDGQESSDSAERSINL